MDYWDCGWIVDPEILAHQIVENLGVALSQFESIVEELERPSNPK